MNLTQGVTINPGDVITRQTIYNLVANAQGGLVGAADLDSTVLTIVSQSSPPTPVPGLLWWDKTSQLLKLYVDVLDGTGVSVWCAIGPDRFDIPMLAANHLPFGAAVQLLGTGRRAILPPDPITLRAITPTNNQIWENWKVVGFNQGASGQDPGGALSAQSSNATTASDAWFACAVDGICWSWHPVDRVHQAPRISAGGGSQTWDTLPSQISGFTGPSGISNIAGALVASDFSNVNNSKSHSGVARSLVTAATTGSFWNKVIFWGARVGRQ